MKLIRYTSPQTADSHPINRLFDLNTPSIGRFGSLFDEFFGGETAYNQPAADFYEDDANFYVRFELPGVSKDAVDLELENGVLSIQHEDRDESGEHNHRSAFKRSISVPEGVDPEKVSAAMRDGILTVTMPKAEARKPRQISVQ